MIKLDWRLESNEGVHTAIIASYTKCAHLLYVGSRRVRIELYTLTLSCNGLAPWVMTRVITLR